MYHGDRGSSQAHSRSHLRAKHFFMSIFAVEAVTLMDKMKRALTAFSSIYLILAR